jgi:hypothetical protein
MVGRIGELKSFRRVATDNASNLSEAQVDLGGGYIVTARHFSLPGDDSFPLPGEFVLCSQVGAEWIAHAFIDPEFAPLAESGERVLTSRSALGAVAAKVHLKSNGTTEVNGADPVAMAPLVADELDRIKEDLTTIIDAVSQGLTAVGAGLAANGATGASTFESAVLGLPSSP